jgi:hypothetical protein
MWRKRILSAASTREGKGLEKFSLLGGPLHRLGRRPGLVRGETNMVALGLALGLLSWSILLARNKSHLTQFMTFTARKSRRIVPKR